MTKRKTPATDNGTNPPTAASKKAAAVPVAGDLDKVRNILFGAQNRELHERLASMTEYLDGEITSLKEETDRRFMELEALVKKGDMALGKRVSAEQRQRTEANADLAVAIEAVAQALQENREHLDKLVEKTERAIRATIKDESNKAAKERAKNRADLTAQFNASTEELTDAKTDRFGLADLLEEVSSRLRNNDTSAEEGG